jgi:hypothetical protein
MAHHWSVWPQSRCRRKAVWQGSTKALFGRAMISMHPYLKNSGRRHEGVAGQAYRAEQSPQGCFDEIPKRIILCPLVSPTRPYIPRTAATTSVTR